jgi:hypothetical protein
MNGELERIWKETAIAKFELLSRQFSGISEKKHEKTSVNIAAVAAGVPIEYQDRVLPLHENSAEENYCSNILRP